MAKCLIKISIGGFVCMGLLLLQLRLNYHDLVMQLIEFAFFHSKDGLLRCNGCCCCFTTAKMLLIIRLHHFIMKYFSCINSDIVRQTPHNGISMHQTVPDDKDVTRQLSTGGAWSSQCILPLCFRVGKKKIRLRTVFAYFISIVRSDWTQRHDILIHRKSMHIDNGWQATDRETERLEERDGERERG